MKYTFIVILITLLLLKILLDLEQLFLISKLIETTLINYLFIGIVLSILYSSLEGIFQGNRKFQFLSFFNFCFF